MPRELLHDDATLPGGDQSTPFAISVSWGRDMANVQIATINLQKEEYGPEGGWYTSLTRSMINDLIKVLRKARDQAYGADE